MKWNQPQMKWLVAQTEIYNVQLLWAVKTFLSYDFFLFPLVCYCLCMIIMLVFINLSLKTK